MRGGCGMRRYVVEGCGGGKSGERRKRGGAQRGRLRGRVEGVEESWGSRAVTIEEGRDRERGESGCRCRWRRGTVAASVDGEGAGHWAAG